MNIFKKILLLVALFALQQTDCVAMWAADQLGNVLGKLWSRMSATLYSEAPEVAAAGQTQSAPKSFREQFLERYAPPESLCRLLEQHKDKIKLHANFYEKKGVFSIPEVPNYFFKLDIRRFINAERARKCINKHGLFCLGVAQKYVYELDGKLIVLVEEVKRHAILPRLTLPEVQQFVQFIEETGYVDLSQENLIYNTHGKFVFVDMEDQSFLDEEKSFIFDDYGPKSGAIQWFFDGYKETMFLDAQNWVLARIQALRDNPDFNKFDQGTIVTSTRFDEDFYFSLFDLVWHEEHERLTIGADQDFCFSWLRKSDQLYRGEIEAREKVLKQL